MAHKLSRAQDLLPELRQCTLERLQAVVAQLRSHNQEAPSNDRDSDSSSDYDPAETPPPPPDGVARSGSSRPSSPSAFGLPASLRALLALCAAVTPHPCLPRSRRNLNSRPSQHH